MNKNGINSSTNQFYSYIKVLEPAHLRIIHAIKQQGTLTKAATQLHLSQSALSHAIAKLERQSGARVWQKEGRRLRLTQAGEYLLALSERVLPQFEHAEQRLRDYAAGQRGSLRIGMECHPCYQWLLEKVSPFLAQWPDVDIDVKQRFQFGGIGALLAHDIDLLITPDPIQHDGLAFIPVFGYEMVLVMNKQHSLAKKAFVSPQDLLQETLVSYPVAAERLDIFNQFLNPAGCRPKQHKTIETTDIMLHMVAANRGVCALPAWLIGQYSQLDLITKPLGKAGIHKHIHLGIREGDQQVDYLQQFMALCATDNLS